MQPDAERHPALSVEEIESNWGRTWQRLLSHIRLLFYLVCCMLLSFSLVLLSLEGALRPFLQQIVNAAHLALLAIVLLLYPLLLIAHLRGQRNAGAPACVSMLPDPAAAPVERAGDRGTRIQMACVRYGRLVRWSCICGCLYLGSLQVLLKVLLQEGYVSAADVFTLRVSEVNARLLLAHAAGLLLVSPALAALLLFGKVPTGPGD